jgi:16S rRNA (cytidine1402-2'-O)-methyltransferase
VDSEHKGKLYIVATPIGNLSDITLRALDILKSVDFIISEDTRTAGILLKKYEIEKKVYSYYSPKEVQLATKYLRYLAEGKDIALISENGTPCISDPGFEIVRRSYENNIQVIPIPGPSALTAALSACGIYSREVFFAGFIPRKKGARKKYIQKHLEREYTFVFYESKYRIKDTLRFIRELKPGVNVCLAREITKKFEEFIRGEIEEVEEKVSQAASIKGEIVVICSPEKDKLK